MSLAAGGTSIAQVPFGYPFPLEPARDLNGDGHDQIMLNHTQGGDSVQLLVYTWYEGALVRARQEGDAPLASEEGGGRVAGYYTDERGLFSWSSRDLEGPTHTVNEWSWSVDGDRLVPTPLGTRCVDNIGPTGPVRPC